MIYTDQTGVTRDTEHGCPLCAAAQGQPCPRGYPGCEVIDLTTGETRAQRLDGCSCGGIGNTGAHRRGCQWSAR